MTPENARILAYAVAELASPDDAKALIAARAAAALIAAEGVKPNAFVATIAAVLTGLSRPPETRGFGELGPRAARSRMSVLARRRGTTVETRSRIEGMREQLFLSRRMDLTAEEIAWLDRLWDDSGEGVCE